MKDKASEHEHGIVKDLMKKIKAPIENVPTTEEWATLSDSEKAKLVGDSIETQQSDLLPEFKQTNWLSLNGSNDEDNKERLGRLTAEFIDLYGAEGGPLMNQWVDDLKNYFDFRIHRPKKQPGTDNDKLAPSMKAIDEVSSAIKAYILARITHRMNSGGDYQNMEIRVTVDDGTEHK
jgi:hypothetical protein